MCVYENTSLSPMSLYASDLISAFVEQLLNFEGSVVLCSEQVFNLANFEHISGPGASSAVILILAINSYYIIVYLLTK